MASTTLQIKIAALVEGLQEVAKLSKEFVELAQKAKETETVGDGLKGLGDKAKTAASDLDKAFSSLGGRSTERVKKELAQVQDALERVRASGAGVAEIARAEQLAEVATARLNRELANPAPKTFSEGLTEIGIRLRSADFKGATNAASELLSTMGGLTKVVGPLALAFATLAGLKSLKDLVADSATLAARVDTLGVTLNVVGRNAGLSQETIDSLDGSIRKMGITAEASRDALTKMIQAGIPVTDLTTMIGKAGERLNTAAALARTAQDLAVVTGENSSQTLQRLIVNIQQMDTEGLRFMGLSVQREAAEAKFANTLGVSANALTQTQKKQAFLNATMEEASKLSGAYEASMGTVGKQLSSLSRLQDDFLASLGKNFQGAYSEIVKGASEFLVQVTAFSDESNRSAATMQNLRDATRPVVGLLKDVAVILADLSFDVLEGGAGVLAEIGGLIGDIWGLLKDAAVAFVEVFDLGTEGADDLLSSLNPIKGFFTGLQLILASIRDAFSLVAASSRAFTSILLDGYGLILQGWGSVVSMFDTDLGESIKRTGEKFSDLAAKNRKAAADTVQSIAQGEGALGKFVDGFGKAGDSTRKMSESAAALSREIEALNRVQKEGLISGKEFNDTYVAIDNRMRQLAETGAISKSEFVDLFKQMQAAPTAVAKAFEEAASASKTNLASMRNNLSDGIGSVISTLDAFVAAAATGLEANVRAVGSTLQTVGRDTLLIYDQVLDQVKTLSDLAKAQEALVSARKNNVISEKEYADALSATTVKFDEVLEAGLKSAKTQQDYERLRREVEALGTAGGVSGVKMADALQSIAEQADKTRGKLAQLNEAQQALDLSAENLKLAQSRLDVAKAEADVMKAKAGVWVAENDYARQGTELSRLKLSIANLNLKAAEDALALSRLQFKEETAQKDLLISKQQQYNAEIRLQQNVNDENLQRQAIEAREAAEAQDLLVKGLQEQVNQQREANLATEEARIKAQAQYDVLKTIEEQNGKNADSMRRHVESTREVHTETERLRESIGGVAKSYDASLVSMQNWSARTIAEYNKVQASIRELYAAQDRLDQYGPGVTNGSLGSINGDYGDVESTADRNARVGKESDASDAARKKLNSTASDNTGMFLVKEKLAKGTLTDEDKALVSGVWKAAEGNYNIMQSAGPGAYSFDGIRSTTEMYNMARNAMEQLGLFNPDAPKGDVAKAAQQSLALPQQVLGNAGQSVVERSQMKSTDSVPEAKVTRVELILGNKKVPVTVDARNEAGLLDMLEEMRKRT